MNSLNGHIVEIEVSGSLSLVSVQIHEELRLKAIIIETPDTAAYLDIGHPIRVLFKETEVVIGNEGDHQISLQNRIPGTVSRIETGRLLSNVFVQTAAGESQAVISTNAVNQLDLQADTTVVAMIKLNEIMLAE